MSDFFSTYVSGANRNQSISQPVRYDSKNPHIYDAYVTTSGVLESITRTAVVYIPALKIYAQAVRADCPDLSVNGIGKTTPLSYGDRVTVQFLRGNVNQVEIIARNPTVAGLKQFVLESENYDIPQPGDYYESIYLNPTPVSLVPELLNMAGHATIEIARLRGVSDDG